MQEYSFSDLLWTKNITRDKANSWAYMEYDIGDVFYLNFSKAMGMSNPMLPRRNELILLVQSVKENTSKAVTYLSHVVAPIDEELSFDAEGSHSIKRLMVVVARNTNPIIKPSELDFKRPNRGKICTIDLIVPFPRTGLVMDLKSKQQLIWNLFVQKDTNIKGIVSSLEDLAKDPSFEAVEGREGYWEGRHKFYERDRGLITAKKRLAIQTGKLRCEVCELDFSERYGVLGTDFMECHHLYPIAKSGTRRNTLEDLALVCANCHRMLHRKNEENLYLSVGELREIFLKLK